MFYFNIPEHAVSTIKIGTEALSLLDAPWKYVLLPRLGYHVPACSFCIDDVNLGFGPLPW